MSGIDGRADALRRAEEIRRALEARRSAEARPADLAGALAKAIAEAGAVDAPDIARVLVEVLRLSQDGQRAFFEAAAPGRAVPSAVEDVRARLQEAFPEGERRAALGEAFARELGLDPATLDRAAREALVPKTVARLGSLLVRPRATLPRDGVEPRRDFGPFGGQAPVVASPGPPVAPSSPGPQVSAPPAPETPPIPASPAGPQPRPPVLEAHAAFSVEFERARLREAFGPPPLPPGYLKKLAAATLAPRVKALAWSEAVCEIVTPGVGRAAAKIERVATGVAAAREALALHPETSLRVRYGVGQVEKWLRQVEARVGAARERLVREVAPAGDRFWEGIEGTRSELGQVQGELGQANEALREALERAGQRGVRTALSEVQQAERAALAADTELRMVDGRAQALYEVDQGQGVVPQEATAETEATPGSESVLSAADLAKIGTGFDPGKRPVQTLWNENMVNLLSTEGRKQGGLTEEQGGKNADIARAVLNPEGQAEGAPRDVTAADLAAALKQAHQPPLERIDAGQLGAAARYLNSATSLADQQEKLRKVLDNFQVLDKIGLPKLPREQLMGQLDTYAKVPGKATSKLKDSELQATFQEIAATLNTGGELKTKVGKHNLELKVAQDGKVLQAKCKKPGFWSKVGGFVKKAVPVVLTVASFIPVTAPFARVASAVMSAVQAVKSKSILGIAAAAAGMVGAGVAAVAGKAASVAGTVANRVATVANAASRTLSGIAAVRQGSLLGGLAGIAGAVASGVSSVAGSFGQGFQRVADGLNRWAGRAAAGFLAVDAAKRGDFLGAAGLGASLAADFTGAKADKWLNRIADGATKAGAAEWAIRRGDYLSAASSLTSLAAGVTDGGVGRELQRMASTLQQVGTAQYLIQTKDYLGAASALSSAAGSYVGSPSTRQRLDEMAGDLQRAGQAHVRAARGDYLGASEALTRLASGFGWDDKTKGQLERASEVFQRATSIESALKSGDYLRASALFSEVGTLFVGEKQGDFGRASGLLQRVAPAYDLVRRGDWSGAAEILTPMAMDGSLWPFGSRSPLQGTTDLLQALGGVRSALQAGDYAKAARALAAVKLGGPEGQEAVRQVQAALEALGRLKGALDSGDWRRAEGATSELLRHEHLLAGTALASSVRDFRQVLGGADPARIQSAANTLRQALSGGASDLLRPLNGVLQTEAKGALGEQVRSLTNPEAMPGPAMGIAGFGAAARVVDPAKIARDISPDVARKLGLPWPLDPDKLTPEQVAKLKELGQDKGFLESLKDSAQNWT